MKARLRALLLGVLLIASGLMLAWAGRMATKPVAAEEPPVAAALAAAARESGYYLRAVNGRLAVYKDDSQIQPLVETGIDIEQLRAVDRHKLEEGIYVKTYDEVLQLLEDFNS